MPKVSAQDTIIKEVENFARKKNIFSRILRSIIVFDNKATPNIADPKHKEDEVYKKAKDKIIRRIDIESLDPFGPRINEPGRKPVNTLERAANGIHITTRQWVIRNKLLFKKNDHLDPFKISESERLIRSNNYVTDARVTVYDTLGNDSVDIKVYVQDIFSISAGVEAGNAPPNAFLSLNDQNFLGLENMITNKLYYNPTTYHPAWRYEGAYGIPNIGKSYVSSNLFYSNINKGQTYRVNFNRPFYTSIINMAGGYSQQWHNQEYSNQLDLHSTSTALSVNNDAWIGYAFNTNILGSALKEKTQFFITTRANITTYTHRPTFIIPDVLNDEKTYLLSVGFSFRDYYRDNFIFAYGKTEDVPVGYVAALTTGVNYFQGEERFYNSLKLSKGVHITKFGYMFGKVESGGYYFDKKWEQSLLALQMLYFTEIEEVGKWKVRQYLGSSLIFGFYRQPNEYLYLNNDAGLRGDPLSYRGNKKLSTNYEIDLFAPKNIFGFRTVGVLFADVGLLSPPGQSLGGSHLYQGYGIGLRLKNEHLIFATAQFSFAFYVNTKPTDDIVLKYYYTIHPYFKFQDFQFGQPYTLGFGY
jgi:hypothetical protein